MNSFRDLQVWLAAAKEAARRGAAVLQQWQTRFAVREKARFDLVTEADIASQQAVYEHLQHQFPNHVVLGEEDTGPRARPADDAPPTWIIDPLDGTTNYVHRCPFYCVSIGLQVAGELVVGVVYDPSREEMFTATKGEGAWLNEQRLRTTSARELGEGLLSVGFPPNMRGQEKALAWWRHFSLNTQSLRRTGSTALNLAYVAAGRFDGYFGFDNHAWDVAAGVVLVKEAGGMISDLDGGAYDPFGPNALASNGPMHAALVEQFHSVPGG